MKITHHISRLGFYKVGHTDSPQPIDNFSKSVKVIKLGKGGHAQTLRFFCRSLKVLENVQKRTRVLTSHFLHFLVNSCFKDEKYLFPVLLLTGSIFSQKTIVLFSKSYY